jgi:hypothetical protein
MAQCIKTESLWRSSFIFGNFVPGRRYLKVQKDNIESFVLAKIHELNRQRDHESTCGAMNMQDGPAFVTLRAALPVNSAKPLGTVGSDVIGAGIQGDRLLGATKQVIARLG